MSSAIGEFAIGLSPIEAANFIPRRTTPSTQTKVLPSYLYQQYNDDDDLQAFVVAQNEIAQQYITWFATVSIPVYANNPLVTGSFLDWVALGLYGMKRPALPSGQAQNLGPYNTITYNSLTYNELQVKGPQDYYVTDDDIFRRILTWHLYKGDGKVFNIRWLKRRIKRFLTGTDGTLGETDQTYDISITFGVDNQVNINLQSIRRFARGGAIYGFGLYNDFQYNEFETEAVVIPISPYVRIFKAAVDSGALELPFQFTYVVNIN